MLVLAALVLMVGSTILEITLFFLHYYRWGGPIGYLGFLWGIGMGGGLALVLLYLDWPLVGFIWPALVSATVIASHFWHWHKHKARYKTRNLRFW